MYRHVQGQFLRACRYLLTLGKAGLIEKVRISKSRRHVAELRKALDAADDYLNGLGELDRDLSGHPSD